MSKGTFIIESALENIGAHSIVKPADSSDIEKGRRRLNSMLQELESKDIFLSIVPLKLPGDELGEPPDATNSIIDILSISLAPKFDNGKTIVSQDLKDNARAGMASLNSLFRVTEMPRKKISALTPRGSGHGRHHHHRIFMGDNNELGS